MKLLKLKEQVIELRLTFLPQHPMGADLVGACLVVFGRVEEIQGTRDGPSYIAIGQSVLPIDAQVRRSESSFNEYFVLQP